MPRAKKAVEEAEEVAEVDGKVEAVAEVETEGRQTFKVFDTKGNFVREYSVEASGENAGEMAETFAKEINGSIK